MSSANCLPNSCSTASDLHIAVRVFQLQHLCTRGRGLPLPCPLPPDPPTPDGARCHRWSLGGMPYEAFAGPRPPEGAAVTGCTEVSGLYY